MKTNVLFVCIHNSARSHMAEAWLNHLCPQQFHAESAGLEPGTMNPLAVEAMGECGIDLSEAKTKSVWEMFQTGRSFGYVVTVCDESSAERCPIFPGNCIRLHWGFPDPSQFSGSHDEKLAQVRKVRDVIRQRVAEWCEQKCAEPALEA
ncbi:MAG: arsenate reductase ArsC [Chthoniobacteraceae bacterium]